MSEYALNYCRALNTIVCEADLVMAMKLSVQEVVYK